MKYSKEHILQEIRRTAKKNNGIPLGRDRFFNETGIKETDWAGKYWARWGDAVSEAGFSPNKPQGAYDETMLFESYIKLARKFGRFPVRGELKLEKRNDPTFPSSDVFERRFGAKSKLISRLVHYCQSHDNCEDIIQLCKKHTPRREDIPETSKECDEQIGYVYLMKSGRFYKIGKSNATGRRQYELSIQLPEEAKIVHEIRTDDPNGIESYWHKRFESSHKNGEWFDLTPEQVSDFKRRKFM